MSGKQKSLSAAFSLSGSDNSMLLAIMIAGFLRGRYID